MSEWVLGVRCVSPANGVMSASWLRRAILISLLFGLSACATAPSGEVDVKKLVADRATARWRALIKGDYDAAYGFLSRASQESTTLDRYKSKIKNNIWRDVAIKAVDCEGTICRVNVEVTFDYKFYKGFKSELKESWVIEDGTARFVYRG